MMFTLIEGLPGHVIGVEVSGKITADDYRNHIIPLVEERMGMHHRVDILCRFEKGWEGIEPEAMWQDLRLGMSKLGHWGRIAIVTDRDWVENTVNILKIFWPGHLRHFELDEFDRAQEWVCEQHRATIQCEIDEKDGILFIEPDQDHALSEDDFNDVKKIVDSFLERHEKIRGILISARQFPGWQGMGAMLSHMQFVRDHHQNIERVAIVTNSPLGKFADYAVDHFIKAEIQSFDYDKLDKAKEWLVQS